MATLQIREQDPMICVFLLVNWRKGADKDFQSKLIKNHE
jgi:hypothetical protein